MVQDLYYFAKLSRVRINIKNPKMIWIESKKISNEVFHRSRWKLDWKNDSFDILVSRIKNYLTNEKLKG